MQQTNTVNTDAQNEQKYYVHDRRAYNTPPYTFTGSLKECQKYINDNKSPYLSSRKIATTKHITSTVRDKAIEFWDNIDHEDRRGFCYKYFNRTDWHKLTHEQIEGIYNWEQLAHLFEDMKEDNNSVELLDCNWELRKTSTGWIVENIGKPMKMYSEATREMVVYHIPTRLIYQTESVSPEETKIAKLISQAPAMLRALKELVEWRQSHKIVTHSATPIFDKTEALINSIEGQ